MDSADWLWLAEVLRIQRSHVVVFGLQDVGQHVGEPLRGVDTMQPARSQQ
jgi:hypothetical protein